jgi:hypothetical protein
MLRCVFEMPGTLSTRLVVADLGRIDRLDGSHYRCGAWLDVWSPLLRLGGIERDKTRRQHRSRHQASRWRGTFWIDRSSPHGVPFVS